MVLGKNYYRSRKIIEICKVECSTTNVWMESKSHMALDGRQELWKTIATEEFYQNKGCNDSRMHRFNRDICSNDMNIDISTRYRHITITKIWYIDNFVKSLYLRFQGLKCRA